MSKWSWAEAALVAAVPLLALRAERQYRRLPRLPETILPGRVLPDLSIIVPARNEADNLARLLPSLSAMAYPGWTELIVVDDNSGDDSAAVAEAHGARVIRLGELPSGWLGKPHACQQGAAAATGQWLLFTDADTLHTPYGTARAMQFALQNDLDGVSLFLAQETYGWQDRLALMAAFAGLFAGLPPGQPLLNGQYILVRRSAYDATGGFAAVREEPLEDLALGRRLSQQGYRVPAVVGQSAGSVRMYRSARQMWHGLARIGSGSMRWSGPWALASALFIAGSAIPLMNVPAAVNGKVKGRWALASWTLVVLGFIPWARRFGNGTSALLAPAGALAVQLAAIWGMLSALLGRGVTWKDRPVARSNR